MNSTTDAIWAVGASDDRVRQSSSSRALEIYGAERVPTHGRARRRVEPLQLDRPARAGRREPAHALLHGEGRGARRPRARPAHADFRRFPRAAGRVRPRGGPHDARDRAGRARARDVRRGHAAAKWGARQRAARRRDGRDQGGRAGLPAAIHGSQFWRLGNFCAGLGRVGRADDVRGAPARRAGLQGGLRRDRAEDPTSSGSGSSSCTRSAARDAVPPRCDRGSRAWRRCDAHVGDEAVEIAGHGRDRRVPERREVDARQPADRDAHRGRPRDARRHARPQGAPLRVVRDDVPAHRHGRCRPRGHGAVRPAGRRAGARRRSRRRTSSSSSSTRRRE